MDISKVVWLALAAFPLEMMMKRKNQTAMKKTAVLTLLGFVLITLLLLGIFYKTFPESSIYVPSGLLKVLLLLGNDVNSRDHLGFTSLHFCSMLGQCDHIKALISCGADVEAKNNQGWTPLHTAVINYRGGLDVIGLLLENGANIEAKTNNGKTPLLWAASNHNDPKLIEYLIRHGSAISAADNEGTTALHHAVERENYLTTTSLLNYGANIMAANNNKATPLKYALMLKDKRFAKLLTDFVDVGQKDINGRTPLHLVAMAGEIELAKVLVKRGANIDAKDASGEDPLQLARMYNLPDSDIVKYLESIGK